MGSYVRKILVLGASDRARRELSSAAVAVAYANGYRGTAYLVGMDDSMFWEERTKHYHERDVLGGGPLSADAVAMLNTVALFDRLSTVERMADVPQDVIVVHDWLCSYPAFDPDTVSETVMDICKSVYAPYTALGEFDYVVAADKDSEHVPNLEWLKDQCGLDWESVVDFEGYPEGLARLIAGA